MLSIRLWAQAEDNSLEGWVYDEKGEPIANVIVQLIPRNDFDVSDSRGHFKFKGIPEGNYQLLLEHVSYQSLRISDVQIRSGEQLILDSLVMGAVILESDVMVVTARRVERVPFDLPNPLNIIDANSIALRSAKTSAEALREEEGLFVQKTNHGGGSAIMRGLSSNQILILVDGIRLNNSLYRLGNHQYLTTVDQNSLRRIEVVRGPTSVQYGSDALGGTINLLTHVPVHNSDDFSWQYRLDSRYASADQEKMLHGGVTVGLKKWALQTGFSYKDFGDLRRGANSDYRRIERTGEGLKQSPNAYTAYDFDAKLMYHIGPGEDLVLAYQFSDQSEVPRYDKYENDGFYRWVYEPQQRQLLYATYRTKFYSPYIQSLRATLSWHDQQEGRQFQKTAQSTQTEELDRARTFGMTIEGNSTFRKNRLSYGTEIYSDQISSRRQYRNPQTLTITRDLLARYPDGARYHSFGIFVQDEIYFSPHWITTLGSRFSYFSTNFNNAADTSSLNPVNRFEQSFKALTFSLASLYKWNDQVHFNLNVGQAFRAPNLSDISKFGQSKGKTFEIPNPNLEPEKMISIDGGIKINAARLRGTASLYYAAIFDLLASADDLYNGASTIEIDGVTYKVKSKQNIGQAYIWGVEASVNWTFIDHWSLYGNVTRTYGQNTTMNEPVGGIPPLFGLSGLRWHKIPWHLEAYLRFAGKQERLSADDLDDPRIPDGGTPPWQTFNVRGRYQWNHWLSLQLALENIFDYNYREHGSGLNGPGRNVILGISISGK